MFIKDPFSSRPSVTKTFADIDPNFQLPENVPADMRFHDACQVPFDVYGVAPNRAGVLCRLSESMLPSCSEPACDLRQTQLSLPCFGHCLKPAICPTLPRAVRAGLSFLRSPTPSSGRSRVLSPRWIRARAAKCSKAVLSRCLADCGITRCIFLCIMV